MKLYSDFSGQRTKQIVGDVFALAVLIGGIVVAVLIHNAIAAFSGVGRDVEQAGSGLASTMSDIGDTLAGVPIIGGSIRAPFDAAGGAGSTLATAGEDWQRTVNTIAAFTAWTIVALVVVVLVFGWIRPRIAGISRRAAVAQLAGSPASFDLLAFRALATLPAQELARLNPDVVAAWRRGDPAVIRELAALELRTAGIRLSPGR